MPDKDYGDIQEIVKDLASGFQLARMYSCSHPRTQESLKALYGKTAAVLRQEGSIEIGFIKDEVFWKDQVFFDLSRRIKDFLKALEAHEISVLRLHPGLKQKELEKFLVVLSDKNLALGGEKLSRYLKSQGVIHIETGRIKDKNSAQEEAGQEKKLAQELAGYIGQYQNTLAELEKAFGGILEGPAGAEAWRNVARDIASQPALHLSLFSAAGAIKKHDDYTFVHCLNVALLANLQARNLGLGEEDLLRVTLGGLLHDAGKIYISKYILNSKAEMSAAEFERIKSHTIEGAKLLIRQGGFDKAVALIAFQHHRHFQPGGGYPKSSFLRPPHLLSRIVTIADVYDALRSRRSYKSEVLAEQVYQIMAKEKGRLFDPMLLDKFFALVGVWPTGAIVKLRSGHIGMVIKQNPSSIWQPQVEVFYTAGYRRLPQSYIIDLSAAGKEDSIEKSLHPQGEGRKFVREILNAET